MNGKRVLDFSVAWVGIAIGWPVAIAIYVAMWRTGDRGPLLYGARRNGEDGQVITVFKFRTMHVGRPGSPLTMHDDDRVTRLGRLLRAYKIDELPQLLNVVRGEMSLVGPRPEDPRFIDWSDSLHRTVFSARPGITGIAQLRYRNEGELLKGLDAEAVYRSAILPDKLRLDAEYLRRRSMRLDAKILLETARRVLSR